MEIIKTVKEMEKKISLVKRKGKTIGFVPTMGFLHEGHLSLVRKGRKDNDFLVVSIFVNPTQFGPDEDYKEYPRDLAADAEKIDKLSVDYIFVPEVAEMYPEGYNSFVEVRGLTDYLCGASRPGHFTGVATIVTKFFNIVQPDRAYFGQKDFQQLMVIKKMVSDLNLPVRVEGIPIIREEDGLALSSRNKYLSTAERKAALVLYRSLKRAEELYRKGERDAARIRGVIREIIEKEALTKVDYIGIVNPATMEEYKTIKDQVLIALAVFVGNTRLIDNILINEN